MEMDTFVRRENIEVLRVRADLRGRGPSEAFRILEAKLPRIKGRKFYGTIRTLPAGEEYYACVERQPGEDPEALQVESGTIPGGLYMRRKVFDWERVVAAGRLPSICEDLARTCRTDPIRPQIEFYRSRTELHLLLPVLSEDRPVGTV
jgi:hypothetical protein